MSNKQCQSFPFFRKNLSGQERISSHSDTGRKGFRTGWTSSFSGRKSNSTNSIPHKHGKVNNAMMLMMLMLMMMMMCSVNNDMNIVAWVMSSSNIPWFLAMGKYYLGAKQVKDSDRKGFIWPEICLNKFLLTHASMEKGMWWWRWYVSQEQRN